jgi:hypothetical protein
VADELRYKLEFLWRAFLALQFPEKIPYPDFARLPKQALVPREFFSV